MATTPRPLVAGNWKMYKTLAPARELLTQLRDRLPANLNADVLICPPTYLLFPMAKAVAGTPFLLGAQNTHEAIEGAFTGETSAPMLKDTGCQYVIVGHSERRQLFAETAERLHKKLRAVLAADMTAIYCVGETLAQREARQTHAVIQTQLADVLSVDLPAARLVIAYEPVWAIGTGVNATPNQAQEVHALIRDRLRRYFQDAAAGIRILYGGSVKPANAPPLAAQPDINGMLVGGASLVADDFLAIISAVSSAHAPGR